MLTNMSDLNWCDESDDINDDFKTELIIPSIDNIDKSGLLYLNDKWELFYEDSRHKKEYDISPEGDKYVNFGISVIKFDTVQMFWRIYNNIKYPVTLNNSSYYKFYRESYVDEHAITEEDYYDKHDYIKLSLPKINNRANIQINDLFLWVVSLAIGNTICDEDVVVGVLFQHNVREYQIRVAVEKYKQENIDQIIKRLSTPVIFRTNNNRPDFSVDTKNITIKMIELD